MASPIQWTWTWANSRRWWGTGKPGVLRTLGSQGVGHNEQSDWTTAANPDTGGGCSAHNPYGWTSASKNKSFILKGSTAHKDWFSLSSVSQTWVRVRITRRPVIQGRLGRPPEFLLQEVWGWGPRFRITKKFQVMTMLLFWGTTAQGPFSTSAPLLERAAGIQPEGTCISPDTTPTHELPNE